MEFLLELLGAGALRWIKRVVSKKIVVTPKEIETTSRRWDSTNTLLIQNRTDKPLFEIQVVCWFTDGQQIEFKPHHMKKIEKLNDQSFVDVALYLFSGTTDDEKRWIHVINLARLLPNEVVEIDLQIKSKGIVRFEPVSFTERNTRQVLRKGNEIAMPLRPPFDMKLHAISLWLSNQDKSS